MRSGTKSKEDVQSVFEHWCERNRDYSKGRSNNELPLAHKNVRGSVERRDIELHRMRREMDWEHFMPLSMDETLRLLSGRGEAQSAADSSEEK